MFYRPGLENHNLPHNPFKALVTPRPIGWISTLGADGVANLAPYSFFNAIADRPPMVCYATNGRKVGLDEEKDSLANIRAGGEFVVNMVSMALVQAMNTSSGHYGSDEDEFDLAGLRKAPCVVVAPPRIAKSPAALECRLWRILELPGEHNTLVIGEVVGVHIDDAAIVNGRVDTSSLQPVSRLGYSEYSFVEKVFELSRPQGA